MLVNKPCAEVNKQDFTLENGMYALETPTYKFVLFEEAGDWILRMESTSDASKQIDMLIYSTEDLWETTLRLVGQADSYVWGIKQNA